MVDKLTKGEVLEMLELYHNANTFELFKKIWFEKMKTFDFSKYTYEYENAEATRDENVNDKRFVTLYKDDVIKAYLDNAEPLTIDIITSIKFKDISPEYQVEHDTYTLEDMYLFRFVISEEDYLNEEVSNAFKKNNTVYKEFYDHVLSSNEYLIGR